jgi:hypothetical protein
MKHDDTVPEGATKLATLTLVRMATGQLRISIVEPTAELKAEFVETTGTPDLMTYVRRLMLKAVEAIRVPPAPSSKIRFVQPAPCRGGQIRQLDEWVCACGCGRRWAIGEERPS